MTPYIFDEFFSSGKEESISPFLEKNSLKWAHHLSLKSSLSAAFFLLLSFICSFFYPYLTYFFLIFVYFLAGTPALLNTLEDLKNLEVNIDVLMTLAAFLSFLIGSQLEGGLLLVLFAFSGAMEEMVSKKAKGALSRLSELSPHMATVIGERGVLFQKSVRDIPIKTHLLVKAGEIVPLDGVVIEGHSFVNLIHLTGESVPVSKKVGDTIQAGSRNLDGTLTIEVLKKRSESTLSKMIQLIEQAQEMKPKVQRFLDRFGRFYALTIISFFILFVFILPLLFSLSFFGTEGSIYRALTFLIAASPCALIIATPTAYLSAMSACARKGILLKGGITLDAFAQCKTIAFDKTGTLTTGKLKCEKITLLKEGKKGIKHDLMKALQVAFSLERHAKHPIAEAIISYGEEKKLPLLNVKNLKVIPGFGIEGCIDNEMAYIGNAHFIEKKSKKTLRLKKIAQEKDEALSFLLFQGHLFAFYFKDQLRPNIQFAIQKLQKAHQLKIVMLTGDHTSSAAKVANALGIKHFFAHLLPEEKLKIISSLSEKENLAMIGDGMNDAPSLARATVGISMGKIGSASAIDASDIVFLQDDLTLLSWLLAKAKKTLHIVHQNLILALSIICLATTPALLGWIPLWLAVLLHEGGTVLVGLNSLRLLKK